MFSSFSCPVDNSPLISLTSEELEQEDDDELRDFFVDALDVLKGSGSENEYFQY